MKRILYLSFIVLLLSSCQTDNKNSRSDDKTITVSILPQKYIVEKIVGDQFKINVMIPPGASPVTYEPTPKQMKELSESDIYIRIGHIEFEKGWMKKMQSINTEMEVIDQSSVVKLIMSDHHHDDHDHGHHHHGYDPHIWTSPKDVKLQANFIYEYFQNKYPEYQESLTHNYNRFISEIDSLGKLVQNILEPFQGRKFLIFHPALSYFARDYGLEQISIEIDGKEPTPANIQEIINVSRKENIKVIFVQQQFSTHNAQVIANEIKANVVQIDPLDYNWIQSIENIAREIQKSYSN